MKRQIIIIGKRSNLSNCLNQYLKGCFVISSNDLYEIENKIKDLENINFIYNSL